MNYDTGIYRIINVNTGRVYIGSGVSIKNRFAKHISLLRRGTHYNAKLQNSYNKHGEENFKFETLLYCDCNSLIMYEQIFIDFYNAVDLGYNILGKAGSSFGYKFPDEVKKRISAKLTGKTHSEESRKKMSFTRRGRKFSEQHKKNLSMALKKSRKEKPLPPITDETRRKMSIAKKGKKFSPEHAHKIAMANKKRAELRRISINNGR